MVGAAFAAEIWYIGDMNSAATSNSGLRTRGVSFVMLGPMYLSSVVALLGVIAIMVFIVPKFQAIITDFNLQLTPAQAAFFSISDTMRGTGGKSGLWVFAVPTILVIEILIAILSLKPATQSAGRLLVMMIFLVSVGLVAYTIYACYSSLITLIENLATNAPGTI